MAFVLGAVFVVVFIWAILGGGERMYRKQQLEEIKRDAKSYREKKAYEQALKGKRF